MGFFANFKAKRAAKQAQQRYQQQLTEWQQEGELLIQALKVRTPPPPKESQ